MMQHSVHHKSEDQPIVYPIGFPYFSLLNFPALFLSQISVEVELYELLLF